MGRRRPSAGQSPGGGRRTRPRLAITVDLTDRSAVPAAVDQVQTTFGLIDVLINEAAGASSPTSRAQPWYDLHSADWDMVLGVNLSGAFYMLRSARRAHAGAGPRQS